MIKYSTLCYILLHNCTLGRTIGLQTAYSIDHDSNAEDFHDNLDSTLYSSDMLTDPHESVNFADQSEHSDEFEESEIDLNSPIYSDPNLSNLPSNVNLENYIESSNRELESDVSNPIPLTETLSDDTIQSIEAKNILAFLNIGNSLQNNISDPKKIELAIKESADQSVFLQRISFKLTDNFILKLISWIHYIFDAYLTVMQIVVGQPMPSSAECFDVLSIVQIKSCFSEINQHVSELSEWKSDMYNAMSKMMAGGDTFHSGVDLVQYYLQSRPTIKYLSKMGVVDALKPIMMRRDADQRTLWRGGSLITKVTNVPYITQKIHQETGGYSQLTMVVPRLSRIFQYDKYIEEIRNGVDPLDTLFGDILGTEGRDDI